MLFKICGLKEINILDCCEKKNVDFFGMIFYDQSPRYITLKQAQELVDFSKNKNTLEFSLDRFEDYLQSQKINYERVDLVMNIQKILKAKKNHGKVKGKSCVSWRIDQYDLPKEDLVIDGEYEEVKETERITDGS